MRDFGSIQSPQHAFILNLGLESLHVRMPQHCKNGQAAAEFLQAHPKIRFVRYPGLAGDPYHELAQKHMPNGTCGVVSFGFEGGRAAAEQFMKSLKLAQIATHVADARTCVLHPANATHRQMNDEELVACGISPDMVRLSCGIESTEGFAGRPGAGAGNSVDEALMRQLSGAADNASVAPLFAICKWGSIAA